MPRVKPVAEGRVELVERVQSILTDVGEQLQPVLTDLTRRAGAILAAPKTTWPAIAVDRTDLAGLVGHYVLPLAAIPPLAKLFGWSFLSSYVGIGAGLAGAILSYLLGLAGIAGLAFIASKLAPLFEGEDDFGQAAKLIAYSATASWVGGIFRVVPVLGVLSLLASLYGGYLLYTGAPSVMGIPEDRVPAYTAILIIAAIVIFIVTNLILAAAIGFDALGMV
jgi:Yip1 domain